MEEKNTPDFDLESILSEFGAGSDSPEGMPEPAEESAAPEAEPVADTPAEEVPENTAGNTPDAPAEEPANDEAIVEEAAAEEAPAEETAENTNEAEEAQPAAETIRFEPVVAPADAEDLSATKPIPEGLDDTKLLPNAAPKDILAELDAEDLSATKSIPDGLADTKLLPDIASEDALSELDTEDLRDTRVMDLLADEIGETDIPVSTDVTGEDNPAVQEQARSRLQILKSKLVAGPEKRYYDLSEQGLGRLQLGIVIQLVITALCLVMAVLFELDKIPENRMRFMIFSQVLAMLVSALIGSDMMIDAVSDLMHGQFCPNVLLTLTFPACLADAVFCLIEKRVPCCGAFALSMAFALMGRYFNRASEMSQMDTLRKAVNLTGIRRQKDYFEGKAAILRGQGELEDVWDTYGQLTTPERIQNVFSIVCFFLCIAIAAVAAVFNGPALGVQALATSLMVAAPAAAFISLSRPAHLLEKRLHMVGTVICGWQGVKDLKGKALFPIFDADLFPGNTTKLNGVKFHGTRRPEDVISYTGSVMLEAENALSPVFARLMENRSCPDLVVLNFLDYGTGFSGEVRGETVLVGTHEFLESMGVEIPSGTVVAQGVYAAISGKLVAVYALTYAKMRSAAAGLVSLNATRRITPVILNRDFMITPAFLQEKFHMHTKRMVFPDNERKHELLQIQPDPLTRVSALSTRTDLVSSVYAVSGASVLNASTYVGLVLNIVSIALGLLIMGALGYLGAQHLLTPIRVMLYELIWLVPCWLVTEWTRTV